MTRLTGGLALRAAAWLVTISVMVLLSMLTQRMGYGIYCWPLSSEADSWKIIRGLAFAAMLPAVGLPLSATLCSNRYPRLATQLALVTIVVVPIAYLVLLRFAPSWPR